MSFEVVGPFLLFLILFAEGCFLPAFAKAPASNSNLNSSSTSLNDILENPESSGWTLGVESSSYVSWMNHPQSDRNPYGIHLKADRIYKFSSFDLGFSAHTYNSMNQPFLNYSHVDELNFRFKDLVGAETFVFGRYRNSWSTSDEYWRLGMYQPMFMWNFLKPEDQGLTGLFFKWKLPNVRMDLLLSPFYIPSQGPSYVVRDGKFESANPWFSSPVNQFLIGNTMFAIRYNVKEPHANDIIMNPGIALRFSSLESSDKTWWNLGGAIKPMNRLELGLTGRGDEEKYEYDVEIHPYVLYHSLANAEYGWRLSNSDLLLTTVVEWPNAVSIPSDQSAYQPGRSVMISPIWVYYLSRPQERKISVAYIYRDEQEFSHVGDFQLARSASRGTRYFFKEAVSLSFQGRPFSNTPINLSAQSIYDFAKKGVLILGEINFAIAKKWSVVMGMETIGVDDDSISDYQNSFLQYRTNDRIYAGLNYVF
ncbi:MAG: hypothetical protein A4S09_06895 [Proteobacteria bacterium SG_bin7]|nr:MAG: hypothetical protein A4S09_06895 [Proteobacteria bacterium SG_bin7]